MTRSLGSSGSDGETEEGQVVFPRNAPDFNITQVGSTCQEGGHCSLLHASGSPSASSLRHRPRHGHRRTYGILFSHPLWASTIPNIPEEAERTLRESERYVDLRYSATKNGVAVLLIISIVKTRFRNFEYTMREYISSLFFSSMLLNSTSPVTFSDC